LSRISSIVSVYADNAVPPSIDQRRQIALDSPLSHLIICSGAPPVVTSSPECELAIPSPLRLHRCRDCASVIDEDTRECVSIEAAVGLCSEDVILPPSRLM